MNTHRLKSTLLTGLAAAFASQATPSLAAQLPSQAPAAQPAPLTLGTLTDFFIAANPSLRTDPGFARDWVTTTKCVAWTKLRDDEFRSAPFLKAGVAELAAAKASVPETYVLRLDRFLGRYDASGQEFALPAMSTDASLPVVVDGFKGDGQPGTSFRPGCQPTSGRYPVEFVVTFENPQVANGLPMSPDAAAAFAQSRTYESGVRRNDVVVELRLKLSLGVPRPVGVVSAVNGVLVPISAHIEDVTVEDGTPQRRPIYRLSEEKRLAGEAAARQATERARAQALVRPVDMSALSAQFESERAEAKVGTEAFRLPVSNRWSRKSPSSDTYSLPLNAADTFSPGGLVSLRFDNASEVAALAPTGDLKAALDRFRTTGLSLTYVPVGASDDPLKGGRFVVGHVLSVETEERSGNDTRLHVVTTSSTPVPWRRDVDRRLASSFDVIGIKTGMLPAEVAERASAELGQALPFDAGKGEMRSSAADCDFDLGRGRQPSLGQRCIVATFVHAGPGGAWALVRLRLTQIVATSQGEKVAAALLAKYGTPDLTGSFDLPGSLADAEGTEAARGEVVTWGARLTDRRPERDGVRLPLHALELTARPVRGASVMALTVTDWAAMSSAAEAAAAAARRAEEAVPPKF